MKKSKTDLVDKIEISKAQLDNLEKKTPSKGLSLFQSNQKSFLGCKLEKPPPMSFYVSNYAYATVGPEKIEKHGKTPEGIFTDLIIDSGVSKSF